MENDCFLIRNKYDQEIYDKSKNSVRLAIPLVNFKDFYLFLSEEEIYEAKQFYLQIRNKQPFANFYLGLIYEYGFTEKIDCTMALMYYLEGAARFDPYCSFRLYFIYREEAMKFNLSQSSYLELKYLLLSGLFASNFDNRFNKKIFDPQGAIKTILSKKLIDEDIFTQFFKLYKNESYFDASTFEIVFEIFFKNEEKSQENNLFKIEDLIVFVSQYQSPQGFFLLGKIYFYGCNNIDYDDKISFTYLSKSVIANFALARDLLVENIFELKYHDLFLSSVERYSDNYAHNSLRYYANEIAKKNMNCSEQIEKALNLYKKSFFLGDFWSLYEYCELLYKTNYSKTKIYHQKAVKIYENRNKIGNILMESSKILLLYKCYTKGIGCKVDLTFLSIRLLEFMDENFENLKNVRVIRGLLFYAKTLTKMNENDKAIVYYTKFFQIISEIISSDSEIDKNFMLLSMLGKCFEYGRGCEKDSEKALLYYQTSLKTKNFFFYNEFKNKIKIEIAVERLLYLSYSLKNTKSEKCFMCVQCNIGLKEILFEKCKHFLICINCMNKLKNKKECPLCHTETNPVKIFY